MSKKSRAAARRLLQQYQRERARRDPDIVQLEDAKIEYWWQRYSEAGKLMFDLSRRIIVEPHKDTEEYKNGERKPDTPLPQQPEEEQTEPIDLFSEGEIDLNAPQADVERDEDGYLIR